MKLISILLATFITINSYTQKVYPLDIKELNNYALEAREPSYNCFITYTNGDTIKGETLEIKGKLNGKSILLFDGKEIPLISKTRLYSYQDKQSYCIIGSYLEKGQWHTDMRNKLGRIIRGKISLYASTETINARGSTHTTFQLFKDGNWQKASSAALAQMVADYPLATEKLNQEFSKITGKESNNYREIISVLNIYNNR